jgi:ATP-dependent RNA helicase RhlE
LKLEQQTRSAATESYDRVNDKTAVPTEDGFYELGIAPNFIKEIDRLNFKNPTPIQIKSIPAGIRGDDIIALARTGSGKTLAYGIPMLQRLSAMKRSAGLVVVPTRELAIQVDESLRPFSRSANIRSAVLIGGAPILLQEDALKRNPRLVIATPGRLLDHIKRGNVDLSNIGIFILDEADRMLDMGFIPDIKQIMKSIPDKRQTMLFAATMPDEIEAIAGKLMENPTRVEVDRSGVTPSEISHEMFFIKNEDKRRLLAVQLNQRSGPVLVFTRTKHMARKLTVSVNRMGFSAAEIGRVQAGTISDSHSDRYSSPRNRCLGYRTGDQLRYAGKRRRLCSSYRPHRPSRTFRSCHLIRFRRSTGIRQKSRKIYENQGGDFGPAGTPFRAPRFKKTRTR